MVEKKTLRTLEDLLRVVRALAYEFKTDTVFVVGSQAILASMPDAPEIVRDPRNRCVPEEREVLGVDGSQANARWRKAGRIGTHRGPIRTEHSISPDAWVLHRWGRRNDRQATERMAWPRDSRPNRSRRADRNRDRASARGFGGIEDCPSRSEEAIHAQRPLNLDLVEKRIGETKLEPAVAERAIEYIKSLKNKPEDKPSGPKPPWASSEDED